MCDEGEDVTCPGDCNGSGAGSGSDGSGGGGGAGDDSGDQGCCESADDACGQRGDGTCQSGCAWGHDPDCDPREPTDDAQCCGDPSDPCGWNGNGVCDAGCAWTDVDCRLDDCDHVPVGLGQDPLGPLLHLDLVVRCHVILIGTDQSGGTVVVPDQGGITISMP